MENFEQHWIKLGGDASLASIAPDETVRSGHPHERPESLGLPSLPVGTQGSDAELTREGLLGEGGMGQVWLGKQRSLHREVALKLVRPEDRKSENVAALLHEAQIVGRLEHPNIVPVHALGVDQGGLPVVVFKRVDGVAWSALLKDPHHPAWRTLPVQREDRLVQHIEVLIQVCHAVQFAHSRGVIHRDIKPPNVMIGAFGEVYLLDWGVAWDLSSATHEGPRVLGTPSYLAPEMLRESEHQGVHTDVYLLGATLHRVLTGQPRHAGRDLREVVVAVLRSQPVRYAASVPPELAALCNEATHADPALRPRDVAAFRARLVDFLQHRGSIELASAAERRLAELRAAADRAGDGDQRATTAPLEKLLECRFECLQALREWPGNARARATLGSVLELMIERELAASNPAAARALLAELGAPRPQLLARIERAEQQREQERESLARVHHLRAEMDPMVASRAQALIFVAILVSSAAFTVFLLATGALGGLHRPDVRKNVAGDAILLCLVVLGGALLRRKLFANAISRRLSWFLLVVVVFVTASDTGAWLLGQTLHDSTLVGLVAACACLTSAAVMSVPAMGWLAGIFALATLALVVWPAAAVPVRAVSTVGAIALSAVLMRTGRLRPRATDIA
jgi:serine/threonine-protein kinase